MVYFYPIRSDLCTRCGKRAKNSSLPEPNNYCTECDNNLRSLPSPNYCLSCDTTFTIGDIGTKVHSCKACTEKNRYKWEAKKDIKHCVACGISSTLNQYCWCIDCDKKFKKNTILAGKKVDVVDDFPLLKGEVVKDKGILTSNEMKQYSDTKQVWWIRLIKWVLKYI